MSDDFNLNDDDLNTLLNQLGEIDDLDLGLDGLSYEELGEMSSSVSEEGLDELLTDFDDDDFDFDSVEFLKSKKTNGTKENEDEDAGEQQEETTPSDLPEQYEQAPEAEVAAVDFDDAEIAADNFEDEFDSISAFAELSAPNEEYEQGAENQDLDRGKVEFGTEGSEGVEGEFDYLSELGGQSPGISTDDEGVLDAGDYLINSVVGDGTGGEADNSFEEDIDLPDFSFNESFTSSGDGKTTVIKSDSKRLDSKWAHTVRKPEQQAEKTNYTEWILAKLPAPVSKVFINIKKKSGTLAKKSKTLPQKIKMIAAIAIMLIILLVSSFFLYLQYRKMLLAIEENTVVARTPSNQLNYTNYIYAETAKPFNGSELILKKLLLDEYLCAFYFDSYIPMEECFAELRDDTGRFYCPYMPLLKNARESQDTTEPTAVWFEGPSIDTEKLFLTVWDSVSGDKAEFEIDMKNFSMPAAKYIESPKGARKDVEGFSITIEDGAFSSAMSTVVYKLEEKPGVNIVHGSVSETGANEYMILENTDRATAPLLNSPLLYKVNDGVTVGKMDFYPVRSVANGARVTFNDLYRHTEINTEISAEQLFDYKDGGNEIQMDVSGGRLVLEGMKKFGERYVLVYHIEDYNGESTEGILDIEMIVRTYTGAEVKLEAHTRSKTEGGDISFFYQSPNSIIENTGPENVYLNVKSAMLVLSDAVADINISEEADTAENASYADVKEFVKAAYMLRLSNKSGDNGSLSEYFSGEVLSDDDLNKLYEPINTTEEPEYSVMVTTVARLSRFEYFAVVDEAWLGVTGSDRTYYYQTHKIIVKQNGNNFVITKDEPEQ